MNAKCKSRWDTCQGANPPPLASTTYPGACYAELMADVEKDRNRLVKSSRGTLPEDNFIVAYSMKAATAADDMLPGQKLILLMYFAFTSLSTVGFGDFHP